MRWREALVIGCVAGMTAVCPLVAAADETSEQPLVSGAPAAGPGVTAGAPAPAVLGVQTRTGTAGQAEQPALAGQSLPLVLPNTGNAASDEPLAAALVAGAVAVGIGLLLGRRIRPRVGG